VGQLSLGVMSRSRQDNERVWLRAEPEVASAQRRRIREGYPRTGTGTRRPYAGRVSTWRNLQPAGGIVVGYTVAQKLIASRLVSGQMTPGEEIAIEVDQTLSQDATGTLVMQELEALGLDRARTQVSVQYVDHNLSLMPGRFHEGS
jgi:hypothetical protein